MWQDTYLTIGALLFTASRAADFFGLDGQDAAMQAWIAEAERRLVAQAAAAWRCAGLPFAALRWA
jgi:hypothetical protein